MRPHSRCLLLAAVFVALSAGRASAQSQPDIVFPAVSNNAALQYWQAFATLPALDEAQEKLLDDRATVPLDGPAQSLLKESRTSLMFLTRAAKLRECDWGLDYRDGANMYMPHLGRARTLARVAALEARRAFENEEFVRAREITFGMIAMGRQCGGDRTMVSMLVCYMIEDMTIDAVAPYLSQIGAPYQHVVTMVESLPPSPRISQAVLCEKQMAGWIFDQLQKAEHERPGSWHDKWKSMLLGSEHPDPVANVQSFDELTAMLNKFQATYDELGELTKLPPSEFDAKYPAFVERANAASPIAKLLLPAMDKVVKSQRHSEVRMAMLLAGVAVIESGPEALAKIKDPFGDGPFEYRKLDAGFELKSKLQEDGKPVTLVIGEKPAP